MIFLDI